MNAATEDRGKYSIEAIKLCTSDDARGSQDVLINARSNELEGKIGGSGPIGSHIVKRSFPGQLRWRLRCHDVAKSSST